MGKEKVVPPYGKYLNFDRELYRKNTELESGKIKCGWSYYNYKQITKMRGT